MHHTDDGKVAVAAVVVSAELPATVTNDSKYAHKTLQDYEVMSVIGNGCFGTCYKVRDKASGTLYVWKGVDYDDELDDGAAKEALTREIAVLRQLQHPNIVQYYHHLINAEAKSIFIVMECCEGGDLAQLIARARIERRRFEERYVWRVLFQLCRALQLCHTRLRDGTLLHRDIKPANIFLDADGNAKLGDFGLARMLHGSGEHFARTIVGTPYYMSPELMRGVQYDRTSDVWALGCLVYELCSLRPPFRGRDCAQLSVNIASGKFSRIPGSYTADLQAIINCMLAVESDQRPGIEVITRHPIVVRNVSDLGGGFPRLIDIGHDEFDMEAGGGGGDVGPRCKLQYSPPRIADLSSTCSLADATARECGDATGRRLSVSGVFTPDLRNELFYSAKRRAHHRAYAIGSCSTLQHSDPELYESIRREEDEQDHTTSPSQAAAQTAAAPNSPVQLTKSIFDGALQTRLHGIRVQESLLKQRELNLNAREVQLIEWEKRLLEKERELLLLAKVQHTASAMAPLHASQPELSAAVSRSCPVEPPPPIPPRKPSRHDDTYCSIEPNDSMLQTPTVAKLNMAALPAPKAFPTGGVRKVTFQSPKKFISYDIENVAPAPTPTVPPPPNASKSATSQCSSSGSGNGSIHHLQASISSKSSNESNDTNTHHRRKTLLSSIFGLHRTNAKKTAEVASAVVSETRAPVNQPTQVIAKCQTADLSNMWTKEHKRAAFDLLAAMNAAERCGNAPPPPRHKLRQSVRERNLQRNRLRRSMVAMPTTQTQTTTAASNQRAMGMAYTAHDHIVV